MKTTKTEISVILTRLMCEKCDGEMRPTGRCLMTYPPQYVHMCDKCACTVNVNNKTYPITEYVAL